MTLPRSRAGRAARSQKCREAKIATLEEAITKAEAVGEQRRQEARAEGEQQSEANPPHGAVFPPTVSRRNAPSARMRP
jgi:hypothetical protein